MSKETNTLSLDEISKKVSSVCLNYPVLRAYHFGSYARGDQSTTNDVDLYIEMDESQPIIELVTGEVYSDLELVHGKGLDAFISDPCKLNKRKPWLSYSIERDKVLLYDRKEK